MSGRLVGLLVRPTAPPLAVGIGVAASFIVVSNVVVDMIYAVIDPRVRLS